MKLDEPHLKVLETFQFSMTFIFELQGLFEKETKNFGDSIDPEDVERYKKSIIFLIKQIGIDKMKSMPEVFGKVF